MFILGSAAKAKKLPHLAKTRKARGADTTEDPPALVDLLDILQAQNAKIDNAKHRSKCMEQMELPP